MLGKNVLSFGNSKQAGGTSGSTATRLIVALIKASTLAYYVEDDSIQIMATELECNDPNCVPLETLVALLGKDARWTFKILKPLNEVTAEDVQNLPFPASWSLWVSEQQFKASHPNLFSWMDDASQEFEEELSNLGRQDKIQALDIMDRLLSDMRCRVLSVIEDNLAVRDKVLVGDSPPVIDAAAESTVVTMRPKTPIENKESLGGFSASASSAVSSYIQHPKQTVITLLSEGFATAQTPGVKTKESGKNDTPDTTIAIGRSNDVASSSSTTIGMIPTTDERSSNPVKTGKGASDGRASLLIGSNNSSARPAKRHNKGTRPRGCPCCDPDNVDNILDNMIFLETPP